MLFGQEAKAEDRRQRAKGKRFCRHEGFRRAVVSFVVGTVLSEAAMFRLRLEAVLRQVAVVLSEVTVFLFQARTFLFQVGIVLFETGTSLL